MHPEVAAALRSAISEGLEKVRKLSEIRTRPYLDFRRTGANSWSMKMEQRPSLLPMSASDHQEWLAISTKLGDALRQRHPEFVGLVGTYDTARMRLDPDGLIRHLVSEIWQRHGLSPGAEQVDGIVREVGDVITKRALRIKYLAVLTNFHLDQETPSVALPNGWSIRRLTDQEISFLYDVPILPPLLWPVGIPGEFGITAEFDEPLVFGDRPGPKRPEGLLAPREVLDRVVLALITFKNGSVVWNRFQRCPQACFPFVVSPIYGWPFEPSPFDRFVLDHEEVSAFEAHARLIFSKLHSSLELACSRLADASLRRKPEDKIIDAAIGLESILLEKTANAAYRGEMKYRFSHNYAVLFEQPADKYENFELAKLIYDARSHVAHGGQVVGGVIKVDKKKEVNLYEQADKACEMLRTVIKRFLPGKDKPDYLTQSYWELKNWGLPGPPRAKS
jgi:hypothetical protein